MKLKNKLNYSFYALLTLFTLIGCSGLFPAEGGFHVVSIEEYKSHTIYLVSPIKGSGAIFIKDSVHKYRIGDTILLVPKKRNVINGNN